MSRYYNEEWQRRKAYLIRSLFHDIPYRVLSPVLEESTQSSHAEVPAESTRSSETQYAEESNPSHEDQLTSESEAVTSTETSDSDIITPYNARKTAFTRPYSPLPPLIIEVQPNKHDETEEFYTTLLMKMRKIYRKMFLEGKHVSDDDFFESGIEQACMESSGMNEECFSYNTNLEMNRRGNSLVETINLNVRRSPIKDINDGNSSDGENFGGDEDSDYDMEQKSSASNEEPSYSQMTFKADVHIDGAPLLQVRPSPVYEEPRIEVLPTSFNKFSHKVTLSPVPESKTMFHDTNLSSRGSTSGNTPNLAYESSPYETQSPEGKEQELEINGTPAHERSYTETEPSQMYKKTRQSEPESQTNIPLSGPQLEIALGDEETVRSPILVSRSRNIPREATTSSKTVFQDNQADICLQSTTEAKAGTEASLEERINRNKDDPVFVLRFKRTTEKRSLLIENLTILEDNRNPDTTHSTEKNDDYIKELEVVRTPRLDESKESIQRCSARFSSTVDGNCDQNIIVPNVSEVTSASGDGEFISTINQKEFDDIDDVLASMFNNTSTEVKRLSSSAEKSAISSQNSRKRRFEDRSAQTLNVSWSDMRHNFFVGTPKIFKLCSCPGHNCL